MDKKNLAVKKKVSSFNQKIKNIKSEIFDETDPMAKSILILFANELITKKNEIIEKVCRKQNFMDYFTKVNEEAIAKNQQILQSNSDILKKNLPLQELFNMAQIGCIKFFLNLARGQEISEIPEKLEEYIF